MAKGKTLQHDEKVKGKLAKGKTLQLDKKVKAKTPQSKLAKSMTLQHNKKVKLKKTSKTEHGTLVKKIGEKKVSIQFILTTESQSVIVPRLANIGQKRFLQHVRRRHIKLNKLWNSIMVNFLK